MSDKVHVSVPEVICGRLPCANFVGGGLEPVGSVGAGAELSVFKGSPGGWIDDGVGAVERLELRSELCGVERGGDAAFWLAAGTRTGVVLVMRRRAGSSFLGGCVRDLPTLNLLRGSRKDPGLYTQAQFYGTFDCNRTPLAPPSTRILVHGKPSARSTWSTNAVGGWYLGHTTNLYSCYRVYNVGSLARTNRLAPNSIRDSIYPPRPPPTLQSPPPLSSIRRPLLRYL
jgi:hypothetical protein